MTSRIAQTPAACGVVIPLFSIGGFLSLLVISPDFSLDLARAYSTFKYVAGRDNLYDFKKHDRCIHCYNYILENAQL